METWGDAKWNLYRFKVDLFDGVENLVRAYERHGNKIHAMRYEEIVTKPEEAWGQVFRYLEMPFDHSALELFDAVRLGGQKGRSLWC